MQDRLIVTRFARWLKHGGWLHLCAPNKRHRFHANITPSPTEDGWHVRKGYDEASYRTLLEPTGLEIDQIAGWVALRSMVATR